MLSEESRQSLLAIARKAIEAAATRRKLGPPDMATLPEEFRAKGACFVTLTRSGQLRGCIGSLEARQPLYLDVQEHAVDAAFNDFRFPPMAESELGEIQIEISVLSAPEPLPYSAPDELPGKLHPGVDGVILSRGLRRATFLPQVWESIPDPHNFLDMLCEKMGADPGLWREEKLDVYTYRVEHFNE
jgi:AmmeMemoRadiSam system protein A